MKNIALLCAALLLPPGILSYVQADLVMNPDDNTLWLQPNDSFAEGAAATSTTWVHNPTITVQASPEGLVITEKGESAPGQPYGALQRYVPVSPEYPFIEFDISKVEPDISGVYRSFGFYAEKGGLSFGMDLKEGHFAGSLMAKENQPAGNSALLRFDIAGMKFVMSNLRMVAKPSRWIEITSVGAGKTTISRGESFKLTVHLDKPAESVGIQILANTLQVQKLGDYGENTIQLTADGKESKTWSTVTLLHELAAPNPPKDNIIPPGQLLFRATVSEKGAESELWGWNNLPFDFNAN